MSAAHKWQFNARFRRHVFGWRSDTPIQRIKEALTEIKQVTRKEPVIAAEGAVTLLEKLSPALEQVDSSSGSLGSAVNRAIDTLVPIIAKANVDQRIRQRWLERLWNAIQEDAIPYIEVLGDYWGELCVTTELASAWADELLPLVKHVWSPQASGHGFFKGTTACLASLYAAGRYDELLALIDKAPFKWWHDRRWGVKALAAMGKKAEAIRYAEESRGRNDPSWLIAQACEEILLSSGLLDEAYRRYALEANQGTTNLATFRAIAKKYPNKPPEVILRDLIASTPGAEGKWFAAAKDAGQFDVAIELVTRSPTDPRTLARAARDFATERPDFAVASGLAALHWISQGAGYDITGTDVLDAYTAVMQAAARSEMGEQCVNEQLRQLVDGSGPYCKFLKTALVHHLPT
jgi:tetratricopeptide (TPR) repeat protein